MSRNASNGEIEQYYFEKFCNVYELSVCNLKHSDKPDVIIDLDGKTVGVEITNFYTKDGSDITSEQRQNPMREKVVQDAQALYDNKNGIEIHFGFNTIENMGGLAAKISDFVGIIDGVETKTIRRALYSHIPELNFVYLNPEPYDDAKWKVKVCANLGLCNPTQLLQIISKKEQKIKEYKKCDEYWLLVVINFIDIAQDQEISNVDFRGVVSEGFKKVFVYKTAYEQIIEFSNGSILKHFD